MFWKKKKKTTDPLTISDIDDQRAAFRYVFQPEQRLSMTFKGRTVTVLDISAGGLACTNHEFKKYDIETVTLELKIPNQSKFSVFTADVRILHLTRDDRCHCIFENCTVDEYEIIHKYVLEMQKQDLKKQTS